MRSPKAPARLQPQPCDKEFQTAAEIEGASSETWEQVFENAYAIAYAAAKRVCTDETCPDPVFQSYVLIEDETTDVVQIKLVVAWTCGEAA